MSRTRRASFEGREGSRGLWPLSISLFSPETNRDACPQYISVIPPDTNIAEAAITGAMLTGLLLKPQGKEVAAVLNARADNGRPLYQTVVIEMSRRATKTHAIMCTMIGRCTHRPGYRVVITQQDGKRAREMLKEFMKLILRNGDFEGSRDPSKRLGDVSLSNGDEAINFDNGSVIYVVPPDGESFRSSAADVIWIDEAGAISTEKGRDLLSGALPIMDSRPDAQLVISGTPNVKEGRSGLLWDHIESLKKGKNPRLGGLIYAAGDHEIFADLSDPEHPVYDTELLKRVHPGIGTITDLETIMSRLDVLTVDEFMAEYMCVWPRNAGVTALDVAKWEDAKVEELPERPERIGLSFEVDKAGYVGCLVAAWRDERGRAVFEVLACNRGSEWLPGVTKRAQDKHKVVVSYDHIGLNIEIAERMSRAPFRIRLQKTSLSDSIGAVARLEKEIAKGNIVHSDQEDLTESVKCAVWRPVGKMGRLLMKSPNATEEASIAPVNAAAWALWEYDRRTRPAGSGRRVRSADAILAERAARAREGR